MGCPNLQRFAVRLLQSKRLLRRLPPAKVFLSPPEPQGSPRDVCCILLKYGHSGQYKRKLSLSRCSLRRAKSQQSCLSVRISEYLESSRAPTICTHADTQVDGKLPKEVPFQSPQHSLDPASNLSLVPEEQRISFRFFTWLNLICCLVEDTKKLQKNTGSWDFLI